VAQRNEKCLERERLLMEWTVCSRRVTQLLDEEHAAIKNMEPRSARIAERIWLAKEEEVAACRAYFSHVNKHDCI